MNLNNRPAPLYPTPQRAICPVCGHTSYSSTGVHPQCSMHKADQERMQRLARKPKPHRTSADATELSPWQKICPRCRIVVHVRKKSCTCGYHFPAGRRIAPK
jgi:hypothetical protein